MTDASVLSQRQRPSVPAIPMAAVSRPSSEMGADLSSKQASTPVDSLSLMLRPEDLEFTQLLNTVKVPFFAEVVCSPFSFCPLIVIFISDCSFHWFVCLRKSILYGTLMCVVEVLRTICILPLSALHDIFCFIFPSLRPVFVADGLSVVSAMYHTLCDC